LWKSANRVHTARYKQAEAEPRPNEPATTCRNRESSRFATLGATCGASPSNLRVCCRRQLAPRWHGRSKRSALRQSSSLSSQTRRHQELTYTPKVHSRTSLTRRMFHSLRRARDIKQAVSCITPGVPTGVLRGKTRTILCKHLRLQTALRA
jgi:hypothetical protein